MSLTPHPYQIQTLLKRYHLEVFIEGFRDLRFQLYPLIRFCNYSLLFLSLKYRLDLKGI